MPPTTSPSIVYLAHPVRPYTLDWGTSKHWEEADHLQAFRNSYKRLRPISIDRNAVLVAPWEHDVQTGQDEAVTMINVARLIPLCHELWFVTYEEQEHHVSKGVAAEIEIALKHDVTVTHWRMTTAGDWISETLVTPINAPRIISKGSVDLAVAP
jgi:hypothetical protein